MTITLVDRKLESDTAFDRHTHMTDKADLTAREWDEETVRVGDTMTRMRLMMGRRVISRLAIDRVSPGLDITQLDTLDSVRRIRVEGGEATVGAIAEAMRLDASRGSRLVADLVGQGILVRVACQEDGRRSLVEITEAGEALLAEVRSVKQAIVERAMNEWTLDERRQFGILFERFIESFERIAQPTDRADT